MSEKKSSPFCGRLSDIIMIAVFVIFIFGFAVAFFVTDDRDFSEVENRTLAGKPEFSLENVKSGQFGEDLESYISDQIFLKDALVSLKTDVDRAMGKSLQNGVFFGKDGYILQQYTEDLDCIEENIGCLNDFAEGLEIPVDFILAPNSIGVHEELLPYGAVNDSQEQSIEKISDMLSSSITLYDMTDTLKSGDYHYKTDHHWTTEGAKAVFEKYFALSGQEARDVDYDVETVEDFYGTLYSKAPSSLIQPDEMHIYTNPDGEYTVEYVKEGRVTDSFYERDYLSKKDKYSVFFGGNYSQVKITSNADSGEKVLVLKDSYANSLVPFLADNYSEIIMVDLRYYHFEEKTVSELCEDYGVDRVIMIYNMDFINSDRNFIWLS